MLAEALSNLLPWQELEPGETWERRDGESRVLLQPLVGLDGRRRRLPCGSVSRLILYHIAQEVVRSGVARVRLGQQLHDWLATLGVKDGHAIVDQLDRLEHCLLTLVQPDESGEAILCEPLIRRAYRDGPGRDGGHAVEIGGRLFRVLTQQAPASERHRSLRLVSG